MNGTMATEEATQKIKELGLKKQPTFHLYGPSGLRNLVRTILNITKANISGAFAIHELLQDGEGPSAGCREDEIHPNEAVGMDMRADEDGVWKMVLQEGNGKSGKGWKVSAGPIHHRGKNGLSFQVSNDLTGPQYHPWATSSKSRRLAIR